MERKNADPYKGVAFRKHLFAAYPKLVKKIPRVTLMKLFKITGFQLPCMVQLLEIGNNNFLT